MNNFRVGQKVVCIDAAPGGWGFAENLILNAVYTVSEFRPPSMGRISPTERGKFAAVRVAEITLSPGDWFLASRFRPAVERKTDTGMAILTKILDDARKPVSVD